MNTLLHTDVYKMGHMEQYHPDIEYIQSHLIARKGDKFNELVFFGLSYYIQKYLKSAPSIEEVEEFIKYREMILGQPIREESRAKLIKLSQMRQWPITIKAYPEGSICGIQDPLLVIENTEPGMHFCVGLLEGLLLKLWNTCTVATYSRKLHGIFTEYAGQTGSDLAMVPFQVHDFGYRSVSSEETAALSGAAHLLSFLGTDTVLAVDLLNKYYGPVECPIGLSVPASEHSVMCSFGKDNEIDAFNNMLDLYPTGIVSIVSDTYDFYNVMDNFTDMLRDRILSRDGKTVFRPDSGDPVEVSVRTIQMLDEKFGHTLTTTGHKLLNPKVGMIYGDGMTNDRIVRTLKKLDELGYSSQNLVVGVGGLLLQQHNRDDMGYSFKANWAKMKDGTEVPLFKTPKTDSSKNSKGGYIKNHEFKTYYDNGIVYKPSLNDIRNTLRNK